jgi:1-acyl-sn-glycerol-3-phosphate acyltransferase
MVKLVEKRTPDPKFYSASFVSLTQIIHVSFILSIIKKVFSIQYPVFSDTYLINKLSWMPILLVWLIIVHVYYKKRYAKLEKLYSGQKVVTLRNTVIVFSLLLVPLIFTILLLRK